jgi:hypothetical protein
MSSTRRDTISLVIDPGSLTAMPSASVSPAQGMSVPFIMLYIEG